MALSSIADLLATPNITYKVLSVSHGHITLEGPDETSLCLPKTTISGLVKVGDEVVVAVRQAREVSRANGLLAKDLLREMLKDDEFIK